MKDSSHSFYKKNKSDEIFRGKNIFQPIFYFQGSLHATIDENLHHTQSYVRYVSLDLSFLVSLPSGKGVS